jgi:hypothetical protein
MALITASKMLSVLAPVIARYRTCAETKSDLGPVVDLWAAGEAAASLGFSAVRLSDDREAAVLCPAAKLFSTLRASETLRVAVGTGVAGRKLIDAQLEAVYLGPEAIQRREIAAFMIDPTFLTGSESWIVEMHRTEGLPGAPTLAAAMELWSWTLNHLRYAQDSRGLPIFRDARQAVTFPMADALCWLLAARALALDVLALQNTESFYADLAIVFCAQAASSVAQICTGLLFGCAPEFAHGNEACDEFTALRTKLYRSLAGATPARERASQFISNVDVAELV